jgi:hypothetical protein
VVRERRFAGKGAPALRFASTMNGFGIRRAASLLLVALLVLPPGHVWSAPSSGTIQGTVVLEGRPLSGVTVAFIELESGDVVRAVSGEDGSFAAEAAPGEYAVTTESRAGLAIGHAPVRVAVTPGQVASADVELLTVPSALPQQTPPEGTPQEPPPDMFDTGAGEGQPQAPEGQPQAPAGPVWAETTGSGAEIRFEPVTCFVAGEFPLLDAEMLPMQSVARARVFFKAAVSESFFYVEMTQEEGRFYGKLPRPQVAASPIRYYVQATTTDFEESQTREIDAIVVEDEAECGDLKVAAFGPPGAVTVFSAASGVSVIAPAGFAALSAGLAIGTVAIIAGAAATAGIVGGVVVPPPGGGGGTPPPIVIVPTPIPTPVPVPSATPTPLTTFR